MVIKLLIDFLRRPRTRTMDLQLAQRIQNNYGDEEVRRFNNGEPEAAVLLENVHHLLITF